jgi:hypothetical protein
MSALPSIQIESIQTVRQDANHNAFTDLCRYDGRFYLAFRSCPDGHTFAGTSRIVVLSSDDGKDWSEAFTFGVQGRDSRDPQFLIFKETLFVYTGTWLMPETGQPISLNNNVGYGAWTEDGSNWDGPHLLEGTYGHFIWRAAAYGDRAYLCARRRRSFQAGIEREEEPESIEAAMLESFDGRVWQFRTFFTEDHGCETAFLFEPDGSVLGFAREDAGQRARVLRSAPPYEEWTRVFLDRNVGGPVLARWGDHYLVAGRKRSEAGASTVLYWLAEDQLHEVIELPSGGDCSYPGFVETDDGGGLLSYYSSHEGSTSIYLAEFSLQ